MGWGREGLNNGGKKREDDEWGQTNKLPVGAKQRQRRENSRNPLRRFCQILNSLNSRRIQLRSFLLSDKWKEGGEFNSSVCRIIINFIKFIKMTKSGSDGSIRRLILIKKSPALVSYLGPVYALLRFPNIYIYH